MQQNIHDLKEMAKGINPNTAKQIADYFKKYRIYIRNSKNHYQLKKIAMEINSLNLKISDNIVTFFELHKQKILKDIIEKIRKDHKTDISPDFSLNDVKKVLKKNKINSNIRNVVIKAITKPMMIDLSIEDFYTIIKNSNKLKAYKIKLKLKEVLKIDSILKPKLRGIKGAIIIIFVPQKARFCDLENTWDKIRKRLPVKYPISFSFGVKKHLSKIELYMIVGL